MVFKGNHHYWTCCGWTKSISDHLGTMGNHSVGWRLQGKSNQTPGFSLVVQDLFRPWYFSLLPGDHNAHDQLPPKFGFPFTFCKNQAFESPHLKSKPAKSFPLKATSCQLPWQSGEGTCAFSPPRKNPKICPVKSIPIQPERKINTYVYSFQQHSICLSPLEKKKVQ